MGGRRTVPPTSGRSGVCSTRCSPGFARSSGDTVSEVLARVLKTDPDWERLPSETPESIRALLRRSLQKDQKLRFRDIHDASLEIDDVQSGTQRGDPIPKVRSGRRERLAWASALCDGHADCCCVGRAGLPSSTHRSGGPSRNKHASNQGFIGGDIAGRTEGCLPRQVRRQITIVVAEVGLCVGSSVAGNRARIIPLLVTGQPIPRILCRCHVEASHGHRRRSVKTLVSVAPVPLGGAWNSENTIVFSASPGRPIFRVSAEGGEPSEVTRFESHQTESFLHRSSFPTVGTFSFS